MGGFRSGWQGSSAPTVESLRKLDLADLDRLELRNEGDQKALGSTLVELRRLILDPNQHTLIAARFRFASACQQLAGWTFQGDLAKARVQGASMRLLKGPLRSPPNRGWWLMPLSAQRTPRGKASRGCGLNPSK